MIEDLFDRGNNTDWDRFFEGFRGDSFKKTASLDELHFLLSIMADYDRDKLDKYIFNSACESMENEGVGPSEDITELSRLVTRKFLNVGLKIYSFFRENPYRVHFEVREDNLPRETDLEIDDGSFNDEYLEFTPIVPAIVKREPFVPYIVR